MKLQKIYYTMISIILSGQSPARSRPICKLHEWNDSNHMYLKQVVRLHNIHSRMPVLFFFLVLLKNKNPSITKTPPMRYSHTNYNLIIVYYLRRGRIDNNYIINMRSRSAQPDSCHIIMNYLLYHHLSEIYII